MPNSELSIPPKPDKYSNLTLGPLIDAVPNDCTWLLREVSPYREINERYFCHIHQKSCEFSVIAGRAVTTNGISCKETDVSPEEAFRQALRAYEKAINT